MNYQDLPELSSLPPTKISLTNKIRSPLTKGPSLREFSRFSYLRKGSEGILLRGYHPFKLLIKTNDGGIPGVFDLIGLFRLL